MSDRWARLLETLAQGIAAGLDLPRAMALAGAAAGGELAARAPEWERALAAGRPLAEVLHAGGVDPAVVAVIAAGERSGRLPELCRMLAGQRRTLQDLLRTALARLAYPALLLHAALTLPVLVAVVAGMAPAWAIVLGPLALWLAVAAAWLAWRRDRARRRLWLRWPLDRVCLPLITARAALAQAAAAAAGLRSDQAMELVGQATTHPIIEARLCAAAQRLRRDGRTGLAEAWRAGGLPEWAVDALAAGEAAGRIEQAALDIAREAELRFRWAAEWAARLATGAIYGVAVALTVAAILWIFTQVYLGPLRALSV